MASYRNNPDLVYWEKQGRDRLCALHCCNSLMQGPSFSEAEMGKVAQEFDARERKLMAEAGTMSEDYKKLVAGGSNNAADDGYFSFQVMEECLRKRGIACVPLNRPDMRHVARDLNSQEAYICHMNDHWFAVRKVNGKWYNLDSLKPAARPLGEAGLELFLSTMRESGYTIFVVTGPLPKSERGNKMLQSHQYYITAKEMKEMEEAHKAKEKAEMQAADKMVNGGDSEGQFGTVMDPRKKAKVEHSWPTSGGQRLDTGGGASSSAAAAPIGMDVDDPELAAAIAASMETFTQQLPKAPEEPAPGPGVVTIQIRGTAGERLTRRFLTTHTLKQVFHWLESPPAGSPGVNVNPPLATRGQYALVCQQPRRKFVRKPAADDVEVIDGAATAGTLSGGQTLESVQLTGQIALMLSL